MYTKQHMRSSVYICGTGLCHDDMCGSDVIVTWPAGWLNQGKMEAPLTAESADTVLLEGISWQASLP